MVDELLNFKWVVRNVQTEHDPFMFVLAPVLKGKLLVETVRFVFDFTAASFKGDIISDKAPVLAGSVRFVKGERVEVVVGNFHTVFEELLHIMGLCVITAIPG